MRGMSASGLDATLVQGQNAAPGVRADANVVIDGGAEGLLESVGGFEVEGGGHVDLSVTSHGMHVHLLAVVPNGTWFEFHGFGLERFLAEPLRLENGRAIAPDWPGHGVELELDSLAF